MLWAMIYLHTLSIYFVLVAFAKVHSQHESLRCESTMCMVILISALRTDFLRTLRKSTLISVPPPGHELVFDNFPEGYTFPRSKMADIEVNY